MSRSVLPNESQYQFIAELLDRQDDVLNQLDRLNERIEQLISEISQDRRAEHERHAQIATINQVADTAVDSSDNRLNEAA